MEIISGRRATTSTVPVISPTAPIVHALRGPKSRLPTTQCCIAAIFRSPTSTVCSDTEEVLNAVDTKITPTAKNAGKIRPVALSSVTLPLLRSHSVSAITRTPPAVAPTSNNGESGETLHSAAMAIPGSTAWESASASIACRRSTNTTPGSAAVTETTAAKIATDTAKLIREPPLLPRLA